MMITKPDPKDQNPLMQELYANITAIRRLFANRFSQFDKTNQLPPSQAELLLIVSHRQPISLKELAESMQLTPGSITQLVEPMERHGFIQRQPSVTDRRITHIVMTDLGLKKIAAFRQEYEHVLKRAREALSEDEIRTMIRIQTKMIDCLKQDVQAGYRAKKNKEK